MEGERSGGEVGVRGGEGREVRADHGWCALCSGTTRG